MPPILLAEPECSGTSSGPACDYEPYCLNTSASAADTAILAMAPFGYYKMDDASGNIQDSSGNAHHGTSVIGTPTYSQAAITTKGAAASIAFNNGRFVVPKFAGLDNPAASWSASILAYVTGDSAGVGTDRSIFGQDGAGDTRFLAIRNGSAAYNYAAGGTPRGYRIDANLLPLNTPRVITWRATGGSVETWVDGVFALASIANGGDSSQPIAIGGSPETFWGAPAWRGSNFATWSRYITTAEVATLAEVLLDNFASAWTP